MNDKRLRALYLEAYHGGSHASFGRTLCESDLPISWARLELPARHWKWRMRGSSLWWALEAREQLTGHYDFLFASSFVPLAELKGLVPELASLPSVLYFHENQLAYPQSSERSNRKSNDRDFHYGFTQIISALSADIVAFNSHYNKESFFEEGEKLLSRMPDFVPFNWREQIDRKAEVLALPLELDNRPLPQSIESEQSAGELGPIFLWNHRWEHDKNPEAFFQALFHLQEKKLPFRLVVCGEQFRRRPKIFDEARQRLAANIIHWGFLPSHEEYLDLLRRCHVAVSTANHEFFGISMLEACHAGAYPLVPNRLAYPEHFPAEFRYADPRELVGKCEELCVLWQSQPNSLRQNLRELTTRYSAEKILPKYLDCFNRLRKESAFESCE